jgi:hypothetical protein
VQLTFAVAATCRRDFASALVDPFRDSRPAGRCRRGLKTKTRVLMFRVRTAGSAQAIPVDGLTVAVVVALSPGDPTKPKAPRRRPCTQTLEGEHAHNPHHRGPRPSADRRTRPWASRPAHVDTMSPMEPPLPPPASSPESYTPYEIRLRFSVDNALPPSRNALHGAVDAVRGLIVMGSSLEQAEAHADRIRLALEQKADGR